MTDTTEPSEPMVKYVVTLTATVHVTVAIPSGSDPWDAHRAATEYIQTGDPLSIPWRTDGVVQVPA